MPTSSDHVQQMVSEVSKMMKNSPDRACGTALNWLKHSRSNEEITQSGALLMDMLIQHGLPETFAKLLVSVSSIESGINLFDFLMDLISKIASENKCYDECASVVLILRKQLVNALDQIHYYSFLDVEIFFKYRHMGGRFWLTEIKNLLEKSDYIITLKYGLDTVVDISDLLKASCQCFSSFYMKSLFCPMDFSFSCFSTFSRAFYNAVESNTKPFPISLSSFNQDPVFISVHSIFKVLLNETNLNLGKSHENAEQTARHWLSGLLVLKGLHWISKIYQGAETEFWSALKNRRGLICELLCTYSTGKDDYLWLLERNDMITSECRIRLAKKNIPELKIPNESDSLGKLINWSKYHNDLLMAIENTNKHEGFTNLEHALGLICRFLLDPQHNLFCACPSDPTCFFPNPGTKPEPYHLLCFEFFGEVIALALLHEVQIGITFHRVFLLQLAGRDISLEHVKDADPLSYRRWKDILNMDDETFAKMIMDDDDDAKGMGICQEVYVWQHLNHRFVTSISTQLSFFKEGFRRVFGAPILQFLQFEGLRFEDVNNVLRGSRSTEYMPYKVDECSNNDETDVDPLISQLLKVKGQVYDITNWQKGKKLGGGSGGLVYERLTEDGSFYAVKEISLKADNINQIMEEVKLLCQLDHPNIVKYLGTSKDESNLYIILELVKAGSLKTIYQSFELKESHIHRYTRQILEGLKYLHNHNVIHRDIKCDNILVDENGCVKITDFGCARVTDLNILMKTYCGTPNWMAPEVIDAGISEGYGGNKADIWSLGRTVYEMFDRKSPSSDLELDNLSIDARDFIQKCLKNNPNDRPTAAELLEHPFVNRST